MTQDSRFADSADTPRSAPARVLIAEDDRDIRELVATKLRGAGYDVIAVADGLAALEAARTGEVDIALLDVMMPLMSGMEVIAALRAEPATAALPIILLTARSQEFDVQAGLALGADDYIVKPFSPRELVARVRCLLAPAVT